MEILHGGHAETLLTTAYQKASREKSNEQALVLGLLLADLQQLRGQTKAADVLHRKLASAQPLDPRPLLGQALELLDCSRRLNPNQPDLCLDDVVAAYGLEQLSRAKEANPAASEKL